MKAEAFCEECGTTVPIKHMRIDKEGKVFLALKCGHYCGYVFGLIMKIRQPFDRPRS